MAHDTISSYTFNPSARTVTLLSKQADIRQLISIKNATNGDLMYFAHDWQLVSSVYASGNTTFTLPIGSISNTAKSGDTLTIIYGFSAGAPGNSSGVTLTFPGAIDDTKFPSTPVDGTCALDSLNNRFYIRVNGVWKYAALS